MGSWGFIGLAYGVAAIALVGYLASLWNRLRGAGELLSALERDGGSRKR